MLNTILPVSCHCSFWFLGTRGIAFHNILSFQPGLFNHSCEITSGLLLHLFGTILQDFVTGNTLNPKKPQKQLHSTSLAFVRNVLFFFFFSVKKIIVITDGVFVFSACVFSALRIIDASVLVSSVPMSGKWYSEKHTLSGFARKVNSFLLNLHPKLAYPIG